MTIAALVALAAACNEESRNPVGTDLLSDGILGGGVRMIDLTDFVLAEDVPVFPADRGQADRLVAASEWPDPPGFQSRALFRVETARIDSLDVAQISEVSMRLVFEAIERPVELRVHRVTAAWSEGAATWERRQLGEPWTTPGGDFDPTPIAEFVVEPPEPDDGDDGAGDAVGDSISVPLPPDLLGGWSEGTIPNHGLIVIQETPGERVEIVSRGLGGLNANGPRIDAVLVLDEVGSPATEALLQAAEDTFIAESGDPFDPGGLVVSGAEPVTRTFLEPAIEAIPAGAAVASARLVLTVRETSVPGDSLLVVGRQVLSDFLGENTVLGQLRSDQIVGLGTVKAETATGDTVVFESTLLTRLVRLWQRQPERARGIGLTVFGEESAFGGVSFFGPDAAADLRPRLRILFLPPSGSLEESGSRP